MPFTPLTANNRITIPYIVDGFTHKIRAYCKANAALLGGYALDTRIPLTTVTFPDAAQGLWDAMKEIMDAPASAPDALLELRSGSLWLPIDGATLTGGAGSGGYLKASQFTLVVRDTAFKDIRVVVMEPNIAYVGHSPNGLGIEGDTDLFVNAYNGVGLGANDPYLWQKSRGDNFILAAGAIAGGTYDLNDKMKRRRGLE